MFNKKELKELRDELKELRNEVFMLRCKHLNVKFSKDTSATLSYPEPKWGTLYYKTCNDCGEIKAITKEEYYAEKVKQAQEALDKIKEEIRNELIRNEERDIS